METPRHNDGFGSLQLYTPWLWTVAVTPGNGRVRLWWNMMITTLSYWAQPLLLALERCWLRKVSRLFASCWANWQGDSHCLPNTCICLISAGWGWKPPIDKRGFLSKSWFRAGWRWVLPLNPRVSVVAALDMHKLHKLKLTLDPFSPDTAVGGEENYWSWYNMRSYQDQVDLASVVLYLKADATCKCKIERIVGETRSFLNRFKMREAAVLRTRARPKGVSAKNLVNVFRLLIKS